MISAPSCLARISATADFPEAVGPARNQHFRRSETGNSMGIRTLQDSEFFKSERGTFGQRKAYCTANCIGQPEMGLPGNLTDGRRKGFHKVGGFSGSTNLGEEQGSAVERKDGRRYASPFPKTPAKVLRAVRRSGTGTVPMRARHCKSPVTGGFVGICRRGCKKVWGVVEFLSKLRH